MRYQHALGGQVFSNIAVKEEVVLEIEVSSEKKMTSAIGSSTKATYIPPVQTSAQPAKVGGKDSDGDNDGSKVGEIEKPKATSGPVGTIINTTA